MRLFALGVVVLLLVKFLGPDGLRRVSTKTNAISPSCAGFLTHSRLLIRNVSLEVL